MGSTMLGDFSSGELFGEVIAHASQASGAASSYLGGVGTSPFFRAPQNCVITDAWWEPTSANFTPDASASASFRQLALVDQGPAGAGNRVLASWNAQSSVASFTPQHMTLNPVAETGETLIGGAVQGGVSVAKGEVVCGLIGATQGAANATDTALPAGQFGFNYRPA